MTGALPGVKPGAVTPSGTVEKGLEIYSGKGSVSGLPSASDEGVITMIYHQVRHRLRRYFNCSLLTISTHRWIKTAQVLCRQISTQRVGAPTPKYLNQPALSKTFPESQDFQPPAPWIMRSKLDCPLEQSAPALLVAPKMFALYGSETTPFLALLGVRRLSQIDVLWDHWQFLTFEKTIIALNNFYPKEL